MKEKILRICGYEDKKRKWTDLSADVQLRIYKDVGIAFLVLGMGICIFISSMNWMLLITAIIATIALLIISYNRVLIFEYEKFVTLIGKCIKIDRQKKTSKIFKDIVYGKCSAVFEVDDFFVEIIVPHASQITEGSEVEIFAMPNAIRKKNDDYYTIDNFLALHITKTLNPKSVKKDHVL